MVKLQKHKAYTYKSKEDGKEVDHYKHTIVVPEQIVEQLGWYAGTELIPEVRNGNLVLKPESKQR